MCNVYPPRCEPCRRSRDRWDLAASVFCVLVFFTAVIPVVPLIVSIILQEA